MTTERPALSVHTVASGMTQSSVLPEDVVRSTSQVARMNSCPDRRKEISRPSRISIPLAAQFSRRPDQCPGGGALAPT